MQNCPLQGSNPRKFDHHKKIIIEKKSLLKKIITD